MSSQSCLIEESESMYDVLLRHTHHNIHAKLKRTLYF